MRSASEIPQASRVKRNSEPIQKRLIFIEYRGKVTNDYCRALNKIEAPCQPVLTLRKLKTVMPTLKPAIDKKVRNHVVYRITCPRCQSCYLPGVRRGRRRAPASIAASRQTLEKMPCESTNNAEGCRDSSEHHSERAIPVHARGALAERGAPSN